MLFTKTTQDSMKSDNRVGNLHTSTNTPPNLAQKVDYY